MPFSTLRIQVHLHVQLTCHTHTRIGARRYAETSLVSCPAAPPTREWKREPSSRARAMRIIKHRSSQMLVVKGTLRVGGINITDAGQTRASGSLGMSGVGTYTHTHTYIHTYIHIYTHGTLHSNPSCGRGLITLPGICGKL